MKEIERMNKLVLTADSVETKGGWSLAQKENAFVCDYCKSPYFFVRQEHGVIEEPSDWQVVGQRRKDFYVLREIGLALYCAECGKFHEDYWKWFYPKDRIVCSWDDDELEYAEIEEIQYCIQQYNQKGSFKPAFKTGELNYLKEKLDEYENKHYPVKKKSRIIRTKYGGSVKRGEGRKRKGGQNQNTKTLKKSKKSRKIKKRI